MYNIDADNMKNDHIFEHVTWQCVLLCICRLACSHACVQTTHAVMLQRGNHGAAVLVSCQWLGAAHPNPLSHSKALWPSLCTLPEWHAKGVAISAPYHWLGHWRLETMVVACSCHLQQCVAIAACCQAAAVVARRNILRLHVAVVHLKYAHMHLADAWGSSGSIASPTCQPAGRLCRRKLYC